MNKNIPINERIIFALDFADPREALHWVKKLDGEMKFFKVGLQLFLAGWFHVIDEIVNRGNKVMVDLKFFDIPETVKLAVEQLQNIFVLVLSWACTSSPMTVSHCMIRSPPAFACASRCSAGNGAQC